MVQKIGVIGAGTMGSGIAQVLALKGYQVILIDVSQEALEKGLGRMEKQLDRSVSKERLTAEEKERALSLISSSTDTETLEVADFVIEAAAEDPGIKRDLFSSLDGICRPEVILATNTSSLSVNDLAQATEREDRVVGMHFFNPVPVMKLVEVVKGEETSSETVEKVRELAEALGKRPIEVKDRPGFVVNRLLIPMINEAAFLYGENTASAEAIDKGMELGANHPIGPLALADLIGLDVCLAIMETLYEKLGEEKYRPAPVLKEKVERGEMGRKSRKGFYSYE